MGYQAGEESAGLTSRGEASIYVGRTSVPIFLVPQYLARGLVGSPSLVGVWIVGDVALEEVRPRNRATCS